MSDSPQSKRGRKSGWLARLAWRGRGPLLALSGVIAAGLAVAFFVLIYLGDSRDQTLEELADEVDLVSIRLSRAHVDVVRLVHNATRLSLSSGDEMDASEYEQSRRRYTGSAALMASGARGTRYEEDVQALLLLMDDAASAADEGFEAAQQGDPAAVEVHLVGRGGMAMDAVSDSVRDLRERLDQDAESLRTRTRTLSRLELAIGGGGALLGAIFLGVVLMIDAHRGQLQDAAERARARFTSMVEATGFGVIELDPGGVVEFANPAAVELLGYEPDALLGEADERFIPLAPAEDDGTGRLRRALERGEAYFGEETFRRANGETLTVEVSCEPVDRPRDVLDVAIRRRGAVLVFQDLSERIARERQQAEFLSVASHELRTPLTSLVGFSRRLVRSVERGRLVVDEDTREEIETLNMEAERMREMVAVFLDMSRLEANVLDLEFAPMEVTDVVDEEVELLRQRYPEARLRIEYPDEEAIVRSDEQRVRQVVANLLDNAAKYGGSPPEIVLRVDLEDGGAAVRVRDRGAGIPPEHQPLVFDRFFRSPASGNGQGLGLGLHISKQFADMLGAELTLTSEPGEGTEFRFWLPGDPDQADRRRYPSTARLTWSARS